MTPVHEPFELDVLIITRQKADSAITMRILQESKLSGRVCEDLKALTEEIKLGVGVIMVAEEVLFPPGISLLNKALETQPKWSDLPVIVLTGNGSLNDSTREFIGTKEELRNVTYLERPVRLLTLLSVLRGALKSRRRQYELRDLLGQVLRSSQEAALANHAKSAFLANMSHEIRTPLNAIMGFADLLLDPESTKSDISDFVSVIQRNGRLLSQIIDDILDLSKVEAGRLTLENLPTSLPEIVSDVIGLMSAVAINKEIEIVVHADRNVPQILYTDPVRLKQILLNIVGNAVKFTEKGTVQITLEYLTDSEKICFLVKDTGKGISADEIVKLFRPFGQTDTSTTRIYGGTGLGLILSRRLAEALGGRLELAKSEPGVGSTFLIELPAVNAAGSFHHKDDCYASPDQGSHYEQVLQGKNILVVEDAPDNQHLMSRILRRSGAHVDLAENGAVGVEMALHGNYDIVLMDLQMPVKDGLEATAELRSHSFDKPILAVSAAAMKEERERALRAGCTDHITKPIAQATLVSSIVRHLDSCGRIH